MAGKLKVMLDNLDHFLELLALSHTVCVKDWDILSAQHALEWASYFQHVHDRFKANSSIRNGIEDHLAMKNRELRIHFKMYKDIFFTDLRKGRAILYMALFQNSALPSHLFKYLLQLLQRADSKSNDPLSLDHIISQKAASELFLSLPLFACNRSLNPLGHPVLVTQADILRNHLKRQLKISEGSQKLSVVSDVLGRVSRPLVYHLIAVVLLSNDNLANELQEPLDAVLLDWLMSDNTTWTDFCVSVTPQVLTRLAYRHFTFKSTYLDYLEKLGGNMEQNIHGESWASTNPKLSFIEFLEHFKCLLKGPDDIRESVLSRLQILKSQDGDYDIPGISLWTDVLTEIKS